MLVKPTRRINSYCSIGILRGSSSPGVEGCILPALATDENDTGVNTQSECAAVKLRGAKLRGHSPIAFLSKPQMFGK